MAISVAQILSQWSTLIPFFNSSSNEFYDNLKKIVSTHEMPNIKMEPVTHKEGGLLSSSRQYFRVKNKALVFDVCAAPYGKGFFISWWLYETEGKAMGLIKKTKVGSFLKDLSTRKTFYQADNEAMFRSTVHKCVLEAVDKMTEGKATRLTELERQIQKGGK
jgi:hypothetical protein